MSVVVVFLSVYSDCEAGSYMEQNEIHSCSSDMSHDQNSETEHHDFCSPFCYQDCCSTPFVLSLSTIIEQVEDETYTPYFIHKDLYSYSTTSRILDPPQLS